MIYCFEVNKFQKRFEERPNLFYDLKESINVSCVAINIMNNFIDALLVNFL